MKYSVSTLIMRECDQVLESLHDFSEVEDCTYAIPYIVREYRGNDRMCVPGNNHLYLSEMTRLSSDEVIKLDLLVDGPMISYCKLAKIPHQLVGLERTFNPPHRAFPVGEFKYLNLDLDDINNLCEKDKRWLSDYCIRVNDRHYYDLLQQVGYPVNGVINPTYRRMRIVKRFGWIPRVKKMIFNTYRSNYTSSLTILTSPEFNGIWKSLSYREIMSDEFDVEHLISIGVQVPHINLVLDEIRTKDVITSRDVHIAKKLIPYSIPSAENVDDLIKRCCIEQAHDVRGHTTLQAVDIVLMLVRYKKIELGKYEGISGFIDHIAQL